MFCPLGRIAPAKPSEYEIFIDSTLDTMIRNHRKCAGLRATKLVRRIGTGTRTRPENIDSDCIGKAISRVIHSDKEVHGLEADGWNWKSYRALLERIAHGLWEYLFGRRKPLNTHLQKMTSLRVRGRKVAKRGPRQECRDHREIVQM